MRCLKWMRLSFKGLEKNADQRCFFGEQQKKHMLCKYTSGIYMAKYSELTLKQMWL